MTVLVVIVMRAVEPQHRPSKLVDVWGVALVAHYDPGYLLFAQALIAVVCSSRKRSSLFGLFLLLGLLLEVLLDLDIPLLVGRRGVDLDLEAICHVG
jgi:hypothetical protein